METVWVARMNLLQAQLSPLRPLASAAHSPRSLIASQRPGRISVGIPLTLHKDPKN